MLDVYRMEYSSEFCFTPFIIGLIGMNTSGQGLEMREPLHWLIQE